MKLFLDSFFPDHKIKDITVNPRFLGGLCHIEDRYKKQSFQNVTKLSFDKFYPSLISKLSFVESSNKHMDIDPYGEENWYDEEKEFFAEKLIWNIKEFPVLYKFLLDNRHEIKKYNNTKVDTLLRIILNFTFGAIGFHFDREKNPYVKCANSDLITRAGCKINKYFLDNFRSHIIYIDIDTIWFSAYEEIKEEVEKKLKDNELDFITEDYDYFIPLEKKHWMSSKNGEIRFCGIKIIDNLREYDEKRELIIAKNREKLKMREKSEFEWD